MRRLEPQIAEGAEAIRIVAARAANAHGAARVDVIGGENVRQRVAIRQAGGGADVGGALVFDEEVELFLGAAVARRVQRYARRPVVESLVGAEEKARQRAAEAERIPPVARRDEPMVRRRSDAAGEIRARHRYLSVGRPARGAQPSGDVREVAAAEALL